MPEYEYRCENCQQISSIERSMNAPCDQAIGNCSHCGSGDLARVWGANFITAGNKAKSSVAQAQSGACDANPAISKSCCPCG